MEDGSSTASEEFISGQRSQDIQHISSPQDDLSISCSFSLDRNTHFLRTDNESVVGICNEKNVKIPSNEKCSLQNPTRVNGEVDPTVSSGKKDVAVEERAPGILCGNTIEDSNWEHCLISRPDTIIVSEVSVQEHSHKEETVIKFFDNKESNVFSEPGSENVCEKPFSETEITSKVTSAYNVTNAKEKETEECASGSNSPEHEPNSAEEKTTASPTEIYASGSNSPEHAHNSVEEKTTASPTDIYASGSNSPEHAHNSAEEKTTASPTEKYASGSNSPEHAHNSAEEKTIASPTEIYASGSNSPEHAHYSAEEKTTASLTEIYTSGNIEDEMKPKKNSSLESVSLIDSKEPEDNKNNLTESTTPLQIENKYYSESSNSCVNSEEMEIKINIEKSCPDNVFMLTSERKVKQNILLKEKKSASKVEELSDEKDLEDTNSECSSEATNFQKQDHDTHISDLEPCTSSDERRYSHTATISDLERSTSSDEQKYSNLTDVETCRSSSVNEQKYSHETYIPDAEPDEINNLDDTQIVAPVSENDKSKLLVYCEPLHDEEESMSSVESNICANDKGVDDGKQKNEGCLNYKVVKNESEIKGEEHVLSQQSGSLNENELNLSSGKTFDGVTNKINERGKLLIKDTFESNPEHCENEPTLLSENTLTENPTCREIRDSEIGREHSKTSEKCVIDCELDKEFLIAISNTTINDKAGNNIKENLNDVSYEKDNSNNKSDEIKELTNEPTFMTKSKKRKPGSSPIYEKVKIAKLDTTACVVTKDTEGEKNLLSETLPISHIKNHKRKLISPVEYSIQQPTEECSYKEDSDVYKGFKKRILAQTSSANDNISLISENHHLASLNTCDKSKIASLKKKVLLDSKSVILSNRKEGNEPNAQLEYAQYLGLQPTVKFKCYKCGDSSFPSMPKLQEHQSICLKNVQAQQPLPKQNQSSLSDPSASTNFRITRKVYLCSACGTYYENWNLFLHMREVHNRHICLYCLSMFSQADKLATHLGNKHSLPESVFVSPEQFHAEFKGPCFLMCCKCEQMFSESNFHKHPCKDLPNGNVEELCASCGLKGSHTSTCKDNLCNNNLTFSRSITSVPQVNEKTKPISNIQSSLQEHSNPATKYLIPLKKVSEKKKTTKILPEIDNDPDVSQTKSRDLSDVEDDYDISNAASFCHVNIHEPTEKQTSVTSKVKTYAKGKSLNIVKKCVEDIKTTTTPSESSKQEKVEDNVSINNQPQKCKTNEIYSQNLTQQDENEKNPSYPNESIQFESNNSSDGKISQILSENKEAKTLNDENDIVDSLTTEVNPRTSPTISLNSDVPLNSSLEVLSQPNGTIVANTKTPESQSLFCENLKEESKSNLIIESESKTHFTTTGKHSNTSTDTKEKESQSDTSGSEDKTRDTNEIFTSSSDVSSDEIESEQSKCAKKILLQASSEEDSSNSDKMSLVVDENDDKTTNTNEDKSTEKLLIISNKNHGEKWPTNEPGLKEMATVGTFSENQEKGILETDNLEIINEKLDLKFDNKQKSQENLSEAEEEKVEELSDNIQIAGEDTPLLELILEQSLDKMTTHDLLKESVKVSCISCVYCNHAKKIAVNAKQLSLHLLAEHRFSPVLYFDISEPVEVEGFVPKLKTAATELQNMFLNTDTYDSSNKDLSRPYDRTYECFHCHFLTTSHKELYLHNRKMHQKTILLCIMCKSNFYSYSELLCHLCPGIYLPDSNINFRCCLCAVDGLPSAFRLMVHLRKRHNACDVCLETTGDQQKLSNHVWKHKLHHLCYRCGIAYRNKPDITKHLFWKHGTESVLCKKCLQKKWPHVYHFCIPPNAFVCEECNVSFSKAVALKVHKRLHVGDIPYACEKCEERFISRSLLNKHMKKHEPVEFKENISNEKYLTKDMTPETVNNNEDDGKHKLLLNMDTTSDIIHENEDNSIKAKDTHDKEIISATKDVNTHAKPNEGDCILNNSNKSEGNDVCGKKTKVVDVYDLPPLNLSSDSDDSDGDIDHMMSTQIKELRSEETTVPASNDKINDETPFADENQTIQVVDGVWDNFNTFQLNMEKKENKKLPEESESYTHLETLSFILLDHNYCGPAPTMNQTSEETVKDKPENVVADKVDVLHLSTTEAQDKQEDDKKNMDVDHNYCFNNSTSLELNDDKEKIIAVVAPTAIPSKKKVKTMKKKQKRASSSSSDSSSNSDSTSCSCGTNCSCSSSSSSSSGSSSSPSSDSNSSSSESRRKQAARREKRKERSRNKKKKEENNTTAAEPVPSNSTVIGVPNVDYALQGNVTLAQEETELPIRESDLDTDETETDEDFYDQHPQKLANKLLAEKRNQLLLLAAVAPVNNGTMASSSSTLNVLEQGTTSKKKVKSKRRKKSQYQNSAPSKMVDNSLKLDIPSTYYDSQTTIYSENNTMQATTLVASPLNTLPPNLSARKSQVPFSPSSATTTTPTLTYHSTGSGSETDSKRLSRRRRVPKRFYGDSSDEDEDSTLQPKWVKLTPSPLPSSSVGSYKNPVPEPQPVSSASQLRSEEEDESESEREDNKKSISESSLSDSDKDNNGSDVDSDVGPSTAAQTCTEVAGDTVQQKSDNLYCYCQCPYDEVSEMIACDGKDCSIEWFHFECVGIMVPPKGKWFCPDCRKKQSSRSEYLLHT